MRKIIGSVLDLGRNLILGTALVSFGTSALMTPSLLSFVEAWGLVGKVSIVMGLGWVFLALTWYGLSINEMFTDSRRGLAIKMIAFSFGCSVSIVSVALVACWATNSVAMRYCTGKPGVEDIVKCEAAYGIPNP